MQVKILRIRTPFFDGPVSPKYRRLAGARVEEYDRNVEFMGQVSRIVYVTHDVNIHGGVEEMTRLFMRHFPDARFFFSITGQGTRSKWWYRRYYVLAWFRFLALVVSFRPTLVHVNMGTLHDFWRNIPYLLLAKLVGARVILQPHMEVDWRFLKFPALLRPIVRWAALRADLFVFVAPSLETSFRRFAPFARSEVIPNAISEEFFAQQPLPYEQRKYKIIYLGRYHAQKGTDVLAEVISQHLQVDPHITYELHGYGPLKPATSDRVIVGRWIRGETRVQLIREALVMVVPSREEAFGLIIPEAMACGTPVIATAVGGIPDIISDEQNGLLVRPEDANGLLRAVRAVTENCNLWQSLSKSGCEVASQYRDTLVMQKWMQLYGDILRAPSHDKIKDMKRSLDSQAAR